MKKTLLISCLSALFLTITAFQTPLKMVYVCVSETAHKYHLNPHCQGLQNCTHEIKEVSIDVAIKMNKGKLCGYED
jgi:hypothetical protein